MDASIYPDLFSRFSLGHHTLKNRVVALPVHTGFAYPDGRASPWMIEFYSQLARTGAAMVIVANASVSPDGMASRFNLRADRDRFITSLARLANVIKSQGALAGIQLNHAGRFARCLRPLLPSPIDSGNLSFNVESLKQFMEFFPFERRFSLTRDFFQKVTSWRQAMTPEDRQRVIDDFAAAALRAYQAGFDMVELHGANGYLLCQHLSSFTNQDEKGSGLPFSERVLFPLAVMESVKKKLPSGFPVGFRIILKEWVPGGIDMGEALRFASLLENAGAAYLSASVGTYNSIFSPEAVKIMSRPAYLEADMKQLKARGGIPVIASGRILRPSDADRMIRDKAADLIGLGRALRTDPGWLKKALDDEKTIKVCINCNQCIKQVVLEKGFSCSRWPEAMRQRSRLEHLLLTRNYNTLWVVSGLRDINVYKVCWPLICPDKSRQSTPVFVIMRSPDEDEGFADAAREFIRWVKRRIDPLSVSEAPKHYTMWADQSEWEDILAEEIETEGYGRIILAANPSEPWKKKMLYRERGRIVCLLDKGKAPSRVASAVDFSPATLLLMRFLRQNLMHKSGLEFNFVHVNTGNRGNAVRQWEDAKKIAGFDKSVSLDIIEPGKDVSSAIIDYIQQKQCGTVIMGKRGISGIKRWLLGSVSSNVLKLLDGQSLFLID